VINKLCVLTLITCMLAASAQADGDDQQAVELSLPLLGGGELSFSDFRGQWLVVNYWATWCAPCRKEIPELSELHDERTDITVLGLAYEDVDESAFEIFLAEFDVTYPLLQVDVYDPPAPFGIPKALPTTYVLNLDGVPVKTFVGPVTRQALESFIDEAGSASSD
jgi:thiol-disulfide isomerase/thioredoxin